MTSEGCFIRQLHDFTGSDSFTLSSDDQSIRKQCINFDGEFFPILELICSQIYFLSKVRGSCFSIRESQGCLGLTENVRGGLLSQVVQLQYLRNLNLAILIMQGMLESKTTNFEEQKYYKAMLFVGVLLSETQILVNLRDYSPIFTIPYFTVAYFAITTIHLAYTFAAYAFLSRREKGIVLESYEHIVLPISVLLISLLGRNQGLVDCKAVSVILFGVQGMLITAKIIYFNSVTCELAQISTINKLIRVFKLNVIATLPLLISELLVSVIVVAICQTLSLSAFFLKFTYQKCVYEYILLIGVFCGIISAIEHVFQTILNLPYLFIGEICSLFFYFKKQNYLVSALELKYTNSLSNTSETKQDDEILAGLLFINECLFEKKRTLKLSQSAKNEGVIQACIILEKLMAGPQIARNEEIANELDLVFQMQDKDSIRLVSKQLFEAYCNRFHQTNSFSCFEFTVSKALELGGIHTSKALILYYGYIERKKEKTSIFQSCKFEYLYCKILKQIEEKQNDKEDINFIEFSDNLKALNIEIQQCLTNELKLMEYLSDKNKKADMLTDQRLFARSALKHNIRQRIETCINQQIYFSSNQFKFLYLLYHVSVEKRFQSLKQKLKKHFLASEVQKLRYESSENSLIVLSGFNHGQIINSNEVFKSYFGIALSSFSRNNISEFIPTEKQKIAHSTLMTDFVQFKLQKEISHNDYECFLALERQYGSIKLKVVESFMITVRIYYENSEGFHYICSLMKKEKLNNGKECLTLFKKDCQSFSNKGVEFTRLSQRSVEQLGETIELSDIQFSLEMQADLRISSNFRGQGQSRKERPRTQRFLQQKIQKIERKMLEQQDKSYRFTLINIIQICAIISFASLIFTIMVNLSKSIDNVSLSIKNLINPITNALLSHNRILLQQEILSLQAETSYFPDNLCQAAGIASIRAYVSDSLYSDLQNNTDEFIKTLSSLHNYQTLNENIYIRQYMSIPYLMSNGGQQVSFQKYIQLMKSQTFTWMNTLNSSKFNSGFYSTLFPQIMGNSTIDSENSLATRVTNSFDAYASNLLSLIDNYQALTAVLIILLGVVIIAIRVNDNRALISHLNIVECIKTEQLNERIKEVKSAINQIHQLRGNRIESIEFDRAFLVEIKIDKKETENIPLEDFTDWHIRNKAQYELEESEVSFYDQQKEFLKRNDSESFDSRLMQSQFIRLLYYKRWYILLMLGLISIIIVLTNSALQMERTRIMTLDRCHDASEELNRIQQKMINVIAYNWLKVLSLHQTVNMTAAKTMFLQAQRSLIASNYQTKITAAYSKEISDKVLFGDVCEYFDNETACEKYRNNIFSSGFSMLIPFMLKEATQIDQISSNASYYTYNLCDKTWLLFEGIIPMTSKIGEFAFNFMNAKANEGFTAKFIEIGVMIAIAIVMTIVFQVSRYRREKKIRQEVFSLQTVEKLYSVVQFKPYFNNIYYS